MLGLLRSPGCPRGAVGPVTRHSFVAQSASTPRPSAVRIGRTRGVIVARGNVYVPSDSFGGQSPEKKAATILRTFFTFVAARVVLAQLEGSGRGAIGAYDAAAASDLHHFLQSVPMKDGDAWLAELLRKNTSLGLRLMEVRDSYCAEGFEWDHLQRLAQQDMKKANTELMKRFATASLEASLAQPDAATATVTLTTAVTEAAAATAAGDEMPPDAARGAYDSSAAVGEAVGEGALEGEAGGQPDAGGPVAPPPGS